MGFHGTLYRLSGGHIGHHIPGVPPMLLLYHVGAKSGKQRSTPLLYVEDGPNAVIIASKGGYPKHPAWYHNLMANPDTEVLIGTERRQVHARVAEEGERGRLWDKAVAVYPGYKAYQRHAGDRQIPVVVLEPRQ
jgi:deazaflavin-dependent oxidoreductase (nitroreductase family)